MKKLLLIFTAVLVWNLAQGQSNIYHPFPDSNATWNITVQSCCWTDCPSPPYPNPILADYIFSYSISGDTIINGLAYHKLMKSGSEYVHCSFGNSVNNWYYYNTYAGAFRQDTNLRQVFYFGVSSSTECMLYNLNAGVGDTINKCENCGIISSIDSVLIGNNYRKRFNLMSDYSVVEGIGSTSGFLEPLCAIEYIGRLDCFTQSGQTFYPDTITECQRNTSTNQLDKKENKIEIFPVPFSVQTTLRSSEQLKNATLTINNVFGQKVKEINNINGQTIVLFRDNLATGLYLIRLAQDNKIIATRKIIITD